MRISDWSSDVCSSDLPDTLFGICEGVGQDLGINPNLLRVTLAVAMIWNPVAVLATYALLGVGVMVSRWIAPMPVAAALAPVAPSVDDQPDTVELDRKSTRLHSSH